MIARIGMWTLRAGAVWAALLAGSIVGGLITGAASQPPSRPDGPLTAETAFLVVTSVHAALLAALAAQARIRAVALALFLFVIFFGAQTFMMQIETVFFNESLGLPWDVLAQGVATSAVAAVFGAAIAALVFRPERAEAPAHSGLIWRIPVVAAAYVCFYFAAGLVVVAPSEAARDFYDEFTHFATAWLPALQFVRGTLWALLALLIIRNLKGSLSTRAAMTGLAFSVFGAAQLLYPNPYMPWSVRLLHLIEIGVSNTLFGALAAVLLTVRATRGRERKNYSAPVSNSTSS